MNSIHNQTPLEALLEDLEAHGIKYLMPGFTDIHGRPKARVVPISHLERMLKGSETFYPSGGDGLPLSDHTSAVSIHPDMDASMLLRWRDDTAWFPSDMRQNQQSFSGCSRSVLKKALANADSLGFKVECQITAKFYVFGGDSPEHREEQNGNGRSDTGSEDVNLLHKMDTWLKHTIDAVNLLGWNVHSVNHEQDKAQYSIELDKVDALSMADRFVFLKILISEVARKYGDRASFMPSPFNDSEGCGARIELALSDTDGKVLLHTSDATVKRSGLTDVGAGFMGGLMAHLPAVQAIIAPTVNSYKRLLIKDATSGFTGNPWFVSWGGNGKFNPLCLSPAGDAIEVQTADMSCNPYLALAMLIEAGMDGVAGKLQPGESNRDILYRKPIDEQNDPVMTSLPETLGEAIKAFSQDHLGRKVLGDSLFEFWCREKRAEWVGYLSHVSEWEYDYADLDFADI